MAASAPFRLTPKSQELVLRTTEGMRNLALTHSSLVHSYMQNRDLAYAREQETAKAPKSSNRSNLTIPLVYEQVDSARAFLSGVFLANDPVFETVASPQFEDAALQLNAIYERDSRAFRWKSEISKCFLDALKYSICAAEVTWVSEQVYAPEILQSIQGAPSTDASLEVTRVGNKVKRLNLYNAFWDTRVEPHLVHEQGDYAGYVERYSTIRLISLLQSLPALGRMVDPTNTADVERLKTAAGAGWNGVNLPPFMDYTGIDTALDPYTSAAMFDISDEELKSKRTKNKLNGSSFYTVTTLYCRIIPEMLGIDSPGAAHVPQVWKFLIINNSVVAYAERQTNAHNFLPIVFGTALDEGLGYSTKSFSENVEDFQRAASDMLNAEIQSTKRILTDRGIYDPSRIASQHINNPNPSAKIPLRPAAYGSNPAEAYYPIPFEDRMAGVRLQQAQVIGSFANQITGQNPVSMGQFVKGNKTNEQFQQSMGSSDARRYAMAISLHSSFITTIQEITKLNILQYQPPENLFSPSTGQVTTINPQELRAAAMEFKVADGLVPVDRRADTDMLQVAAQTLASMPEGNMQYDIIGMLNYIFKLKGIKDLDKFKLTPEQQQQRLQMMQAKTAAETPPQQGQQP